MQLAFLATAQRRQKNTRIFAKRNSCGRLRVIGAAPLGEKFGSSWMTRGIRWIFLLQLTTLLIGIFSASQSPAQSDSAPLSTSERLELEIYRKRVQEIEASRSSLAGMQQSRASESAAAYSTYVTRFYEQEIQVRQQQMAVFEWQIFAGNVVLYLVVFIAVAGIIFAAYQLWTGTRVRSREASMELEVSHQKLRLQTSVVGIVVLVISGLFLLLFLRDVYRVEPIAISSN